jgi:hypothetical protein
MPNLQFQAWWWLKGIRSFEKASAGWYMPAASRYEDGLKPMICDAKCPHFVG